MGVGYELVPYNVLKPRVNINMPIYLPIDSVRRFSLTLRSAIYSYYSTRSYSTMAITFDNIDNMGTDSGSSP